MKKIVQIIFSVKNENNYKVLTILGIKLKFKNKFKILENNLNTSINNCTTKIKAVEIKNFKLFFKNNFFNDKYKNHFMDLLKFCCRAQNNTMNDVIVSRLTNTFIDNYISKLKEKENKEIYILTDIDYNFNNKIHLNDIQTYKTHKNIIFLLAYNLDFNARRAIEELRKYNLKYLSLAQYGNPQARYFHINEKCYQTLVEEFKNDRKAHFCSVDFENIFQALENCKNLEGDYVEIGTYQGASARATLNYMSKARINKKCYFIDTYEGFTYQEAQNTSDILWTNTHTATSIEAVKEYLSAYANFECIKNNIISDHLPPEIEKICVANIDVDMYEAVKAALYKVKDKIVKNGIIICEDYGHTPALIGAQKATEEFLAENPDMFIKIYLNSGQLFLIKK